MLHAAGTGDDGRYSRRGRLATSHTTMKTASAISPMMRNVLSVATIPPAAVKANDMARIAPKIVPMIRPMSPVCRRIYAGVSPARSSPGLSPRPRWDASWPGSSPARLEPGCDAVEHAVQAELEALVPGFRVIGVDARFYQARDPRVPARVFEPLLEALALGLELIGSQVRLGQLLVTLAADLLCLAYHRAHDVGKHRAQEVHGRTGIQAEPVEHAEQALQIARVVRPGRRPAAQEFHRPPVPEHRGTSLAGKGPKAGPPVPGRLGRLDFGLDRLQHQVEQLFLGPDVHLPADDLHLLRVRAYPGHARVAAANRGVEPDVRDRHRLPQAVRQSEPGRRDPSLADAAPGTGRAWLVGGNASGLRAAGGAPVPPQGARLSRT